MMFSQVFHAVPGGRIYDTLDIQGKMIETDEYGRICFSLSNGRIKCVCIMQKHDDQYVYYYDNVSFLYTMKYREYTPEQVSDLKESNDWNKPLDEEKMIKRAFIDQYSLQKNIDTVLDYKDLEKPVNASVGYDENISVGVYLVDASQTGQQLFHVSRKINVSTTGEYDYAHLDYYLMILNSDGTYDPENYLIEFKDQSENKQADLPAGDTWRIRKQETLEALRAEDRRDVKILVLADKLSNIRSIHRDFRALGRALGAVQHEG